MNTPEVLWSRPCKGRTPGLSDRPLRLSTGQSRSGSIYLLPERLSRVVLLHCYLPVSSPKAGSDQRTRGSVEGVTQPRQQDCFDGPVRGVSADRCEEFRRVSRPV